MSIAYTIVGRIIIGLYGEGFGPTSDQLLFLGYLRRTYIIFNRKKFVNNRLIHWHVCFADKVPKLNRFLTKLLVQHERLYNTAFPKVER